MRDMEVLVKILNVVRNVIFVALLSLILWVTYNVYFDMILDIFDDPFSFGLLCCLILAEIISIWVCNWTFIGALGLTFFIPSSCKVAVFLIRMVYILMSCLLISLILFDCHFDINYIHTYIFLLVILIQTPIMLYRSFKEVCLLFWES